MFENLVKEGDEEAGLPRDLVEQAVPVGTVSYTVDGRVGRKHEVIFTYDLELSADFVPENRDGEVENFDPVQYMSEREARRMASAFNEKVQLGALIAVFQFARKMIIDQSKLISEGEKK